MIDKKTEISTTKLNLFPLQGKNIELSFNVDRISSDGGLLIDFIGLVVLFIQISGFIVWFKNAVNVIPEMYSTDEEKDQ